MREGSVTIWATVVVLSLNGAESMGLTEFTDGQTHNIDYEIRDEVWVDYQAAGMATTVKFLDGGKIPSTWRSVSLVTEVSPTGYRLKGFEDSRINVSGGSTDDLYSYDRSEITVSSGSVRSLHAFGNSEVIMSGGEIDRLLRAYGNSQVTMTGGKIGYTLHAYESSRVTLSGGSIGDSWYRVSFGRWSGATEDNLYADDEAILTIQGWDFAVDGTPVAYGEITSVLRGSMEDEPVRHLTGTLASGQPIHNDFYIGHHAKVVLVPEPATILLLGFGAVILRRSRRKRDITRCFCLT